MTVEVDANRRAVLPRALQGTSPKLGGSNGARSAPQLFLRILSGLWVVITIGDWTLKGWSKHVTVSSLDTFRRTRVSLRVPHPSQRNTRAKGEAHIWLNNASLLALLECGKGRQFVEGVAMNV